MGGGGSTPYADPTAFYAWSSSALNAIEGTFGPDSAHAVSFKKELSSVSNNFIWDLKLESIRGIFFGAKADIDGGMCSIYSAPCLVKSSATSWPPQRPLSPKEIMRSQRF